MSEPTPCGNGDRKHLVLPLETGREIMKIVSNTDVSNVELKMTKVGEEMRMRLSVGGEPLGVLADILTAIDEDDGHAKEFVMQCVDQGLIFGRVEDEMRFIHAIAEKRCGVMSLKSLRRVESDTFLAFLAMGGGLSEESQNWIARELQARRTWVLFSITKPMALFAFVLTFIAWFFFCW